MMKIEKYRPSKGFIWALLSVIFLSWLVYKSVPLTEKDQDALIRSNMERQRMVLAREFDSYTPEDFSRLPKFDSRKYSLKKRNGRFWLIPREYYADIGFNIKWPDTVNKLLGKKWKDDFYGEYIFRISMYSPQYYYGDIRDSLGREIYSNTPCKSDSLDRFKWNGILMSRYSLGIPIRDEHGNLSLENPKLTDKQYLDICLTALKILNEEIKEIHYVN